MYAEMLAQVADPTLREFIQNQYDTGGGDIQETLANLAATPEQPQMPGQFRNSKGLQSGIPLIDNTVLNDQAWRGMLQNRFNEEVLGPWNEQQGLTNQAIEFFRQLSPYYQGLITERTMKDSYGG